MARDTMTKWLVAYEKTRTDPYTTAKERLSSRFDLSGLSWNEIRDLPIPELINPKTGEPMTFGTTFETLRKTWFAYRMSKKNGFPSPDLCLRIIKLQKNIGAAIIRFS